MLVDSVSAASNSRLKELMAGNRSAVVAIGGNAVFGVANTLALDIGGRAAGNAANNYAQVKITGPAVSLSNGDLGAGVGSPSASDGGKPSAIGSVAGSGSSAISSSAYSNSISVGAGAMPEPGSIVLLSFGAIAFLIRAARRREARA